jgi:hypothetical protein
MLKAWLKSITSARGTPRLVHCTEEALVVGRRGRASIRKSQYLEQTWQPAVRKGATLTRLLRFTRKGLRSNCLGCFPPEHSCHSPTLVRSTRSAENYRTPFVCTRKQSLSSATVWSSHRTFLRRLLPLPYPLPDSQLHQGARGLPRGPSYSPGRVR